MNKLKQIDDGKRKKKKKCPFANRKNIYNNILTDKIYTHDGDGSRGGTCVCFFLPPLLNKQPASEYVFIHII